MSRFRSVLVGAALLIVASTQTVSAFDNDTHFYLTYYIARTVGFTPQQAFRIASVDVGIDYSEATEPIQHERQLREPSLNFELARIKFHAFLDHSRCTTGDPSADCLNEIEENARIHWRDARRAMNPGIYLHFAQDRYPHSTLTYSSRLGHFMDGHRPDFLSYDPPNSRQMVNMTVDKLQAFRQHCCASMGPSEVDTNLEAVLSELIRINPVPSKSGVLLDDTARSPSPNSAAAHRVIARALSQDKVPVPSFDNRKPFVFSDNGFRPEDRDDYVLSGYLRVDISGPAGQADPEGVALELSLESSVKGGKDQLLEKTYLKPGDTSHQFTSVPIGVVSVIATSSCDEITEERVRMSREEMSAGLRLSPCAGDAAPSTSSRRCDPSDWDGEWNTNYNQMHLDVSGRSVTGKYNTPGHSIKGTLSVDYCTLEGTWAHANSSRTGRFRFTMSGSGFSGSWSEGNREPPSSVNWTGSRVH